MGGSGCPVPPGFGLGLEGILVAVLQAAVLHLQRVPGEPGQVGQAVATVIPVGLEPGGDTGHLGEQGFLIFGHFGTSFLTVYILRPF